MTDSPGQFKAGKRADGCRWAALRRSMLATLLTPLLPSLRLTRKLMSHVLLTKQLLLGVKQMTGKLLLLTRVLLSSKLLARELVI